MKARVKATGDIVFVEANLGYPGGYVASNGNTYLGEELQVIVDCEPDYWTRLEHQYVGMAMQGMLANANHYLWERKQNSKSLVANAAELAHALVEKMRQKEE